MQVNFFTSAAWGFEQWDYLSPLNPGIGGSETAQVEMSWRLARRGHDVTSYAPIPKGTSPEWRGTVWQHSDEADFHKLGVWVLSRCPEVLDNFGPRIPEQPRWLVCQDVRYDALTEERAEKLDVVFGLCPVACRYLQVKFPYIKEKVMLSGNGIRSDAIRLLIKQNTIKRNPKRLIWTSSPDRGLDTMLRIFARLREFVDDVELHCFYGWDNIDKIIASEPKTFWKKIKDDILTLLDQPGVFWHGRTGQEQLYKEYLQSGLWVYPTEFSETSCIASMEAQACGALPVTNPLWGLAHNVRHGVLIEGDPWQDSLTRARYLSEVIRLTSNPDYQEEVRKEMQLNALMTHNWEHWVNQYESLMLGFENRFYGNQACFQIKHGKGRVINIGANMDAAGFGEMEGNLNIEIHDVDPYTKIKNAPHFRADARDIPSQFWGNFDTAILGDILEHMHDLDIIASINNAKRCTVRGGQVVVTFPEDDRPEFMHDASRHTAPEYITGVHSHHYRVLTKDHFEKLLKETGLKVKTYEVVDYGFSSGHGYVLQ